MKNKKVQSFAQRFDLPEDLSKDGYHVEIFNSCAVVDGCKNVNEYSDGVIRLSVGKNIVSVLGNNLTIRSFASSQATIDGHILCVEIS